MDAVRGRVRRGKLEAEHDEHGTVYVFVSAEEGDRPGPSKASRGPSPTVEGPSSDDSRLVEALEDRIASLERQLEAERAANREHRRLLAAALERIPALEAPQEPPDARVRASEAPGSVEGREGDGGPPGGSERRSWWREWFGF